MVLYNKDHNISVSVGRMNAFTTAIGNTPESTKKKGRNCTLLYTQKIIKEPLLSRNCGRKSHYCHSHESEDEA
jgi:hypothetical protein